MAAVSRLGKGRQIAHTETETRLLLQPGSLHICISRLKHQRPRSYHGATAAGLRHPITATLGLGANTFLCVDADILVSRVAKRTAT